MSPAHSRNQGRALILLTVLAVVAGLAAATRSPGVAAPGGPPVTAGAFVTGPSAESSAWYCTGQSTPAGRVAVGALIITNTTNKAVTGTITSTSESGAQVLTSVAVPASEQLVPSITAPSSGLWVSQAVILSSGGVSVTQAVRGPSGWSETPCDSRTAQSWYFPSANTSGTNGLFVLVYNPTSSPDVVDLGFVTPTGVVHPNNFQGLVLQPGQMQAADVGAYVQEQSSVATTVSTRTGRVVASELQTFAAPASGLAIVPGLPDVATQWSIPQSEETAGGVTQIDVFNPTSTTQTVTVTVHLASGPVAPLVQNVLPLTTWVLPTSGQTRIPVGDVYSTEISATGGAGVVVGRQVVGPAAAGAPHAGSANAIDPITSSWPSEQWLVPSPGSTQTPAYPGGLPEHLALANPAATPVHYTVRVVAPGRVRTIARGTLGPHQALSVSGTTLFGAGLHSLLVQADGPLSVCEDVGPSGAYGVITMPGIAMGS